MRTAEEVYSCLAVVGADGANGVVVRSAGLITQRQLGVAIESEVQVQEHILENRQACLETHASMGRENPSPRDHTW